MARGRPTKYRKEYCITVPDMFSEGQSVLEVAVEIGVSKDTLYEWAKVYPAFSDALTRGRAISQAWWEQQGRTNLFDTEEYNSDTKISTRKKFNDRLWSRNMASRFKEDWSEKLQLEHSGSINLVIDNDDSKL